MERFRIDGKVAVVTGPLGFLGPVWSEGLLDAGAKVVGIDLPQAKISKRWKRLAQQFNDSNVKLYYADILDKVQLEDVLGKCKEEIGTPTILVNNAGIDQPPSNTSKIYSLEDTPLEVSRRILDVNLLGTFQMIQVFGSEMKKLGTGSIINIGSLYAQVSPDPHFYDHINTDPPFLKPIMYGPSKAAVIELTKRMAVEWGRYGVRINTLSSGGIYNPYNPQDSDFRKKFTERVPLGRMGIEEDLKGPLVFLASEASSYITGFNLQVDGGFTAL